MIGIEDGVVEWSGGYLRDYVYFHLGFDDNFEWTTDNSYWMILV